MSDPVRGITCPDMRRVVREALNNGWEFVRWTGSTHAEIRWPASGEILRFGSTPSLASWKSLATDINRVSGIHVWRKGNRKRSRKAFKPSGFDVSAARREQDKFHDITAGDVDALLTQREALIAKCQRISTDRGQLRDIPPLLADIERTEDRLRLLGNPVDPFDPFTLGESA